MSVDYTNTSSEKVSFKLSKEFISAFRDSLEPSKRVVVVRSMGDDGSVVEKQEVVVDGMYNAIVMNTKELVGMANKKLADYGHKNKAIGYDTFLGYKRYYDKFNAAGKDFDDLEDIQKERYLLIKEIVDLYDDKIRLQKQELFDKLASDPRAWQRWAWLIERRFDEWNIREKKEVDVTSGGEKIGDILNEISSLKKPLVDGTEGTEE